MSTEEDEIPEIDWEPTPEEVAAAERHAQMCKRFPTSAILMKLFNRYRRIGRLKELDAPVPILKRENELLNQAIEELMASFPYDEVNQFTPLMAIIGTLQNEVGPVHYHPAELDS